MTWVTEKLIQLSTDWEKCVEFNRAQLWSSVWINSKGGKQERKMALKDID